MNRKFSPLLVVMIAALVAAACGEKPSAIREGAAARAAESRPEIATTSSLEAGDGNVATTGPEAGPAAESPAPGQPAARRQKRR